MLINLWNVCCTHLSVRQSGLGFGLSSPFHGDSFLILSLYYFEIPFYFMPYYLFALGTLKSPHLTRSVACQCGSTPASQFGISLCISPKVTFSHVDTFASSFFSLKVDHAVLHRDRTGAGPSSEVTGRARRHRSVSCLWTQCWAIPHHLLS